MTTSHAPALVLFVTTAVFFALYLGARKDVAQQEEVIAEMWRLMSSSQKTELEGRHKTKQIVLESRQ